LGTEPIQVAQHRTSLAQEKCRVLHGGNFVHGVDRWAHRTC
jgi:hypothetical protein